MLKLHRSLIALAVALTASSALGQTQNGVNPPVVSLFVNAGSTGTTQNKLAKLTGAPSTAVITGTSDTAGAIGIVIGLAGTSGSALVAVGGQASCVFDGATTAGDYVQISSGTAGDCHDAGASYPRSGQVIGRVLSTNGGGGTYPVAINGEIEPAGLGAAKFWMRADGKSGATCTIAASFNISGCVRNSLGNYTITFSTAFANANYAISGAAFQVGTASGIIGTSSTGNFATGTLTFSCLNQASGAVMDCDIISIEGWGT